jgi:hypothetical protein
MRTLKRFTKRIILAYFVTGMVYSVTGYLHRSIMGKQNIFSPLIGIPMDVTGWPWMVYADLKHVGLIGVASSCFGLNFHSYVHCHIC